ncbi:amidohydrolase family protein [candidate division KSB1 bacterium]
MKRKGLFILLLTTLFFTFGCSKQAPKPNLSTPGFIIDSHMHYGPIDIGYDDPSYNSELENWEKDFLETMEKYNAMACLMIGRNWEAPDFWHEIERGIKFAKAHPDRVIPYAALRIDSPSILEEIQKAHDMGYKGIGEIFAVNDWNYDDPRYDKIWALAEKLGMPIAPHTGILAFGQLSRMRPGYLGTICVKFPNLYIHAAHFGNPWYNEAAEVVRRNKKLFFDITGSSLFKYDNNPAYWKQFLWWTPYLGTPHMPKDAVPAFEKILFGTDEYPEGFEKNIIRFNKMLDACGVSEETREKCYYGTMAGIHNIDVRKYLKR